MHCLRNNQVIVDIAHVNDGLFVNCLVSKAVPSKVLFSVQSLMHSAVTV